jgi:hypothetical protein
MPSRKKRAPITAESEEESRRIRRETAQAAPDQKVRKRKSGEEKSQYVFKFDPEIRLADKGYDVSRNKLAVQKPVAAEVAGIINRKRSRAVGHNRNDVQRPCAPKNDARQHRKYRSEGEEPDVFRINAHLLDRSKSDKGENHRENSDRLHDAERGEIVGEALIRFGLSITSGGTGATLEKRRKTDGETSENTGDENGNAGTGATLPTLPSIMNIRIIP